MAIFVASLAKKSTKLALCAIMRKSIICSKIGFGDEKTNVEEAGKGG